jgi:AmmeMemoRadiSam system protein B
MDRLPAVAGTFYPGDKKELQAILKELFKPADKIRGDCLGVISPHAGYVYSGPGTAHAIASLKPCQRFIILGPNHFLRGHSFSIMSSGSWETPLGKVPVDSELAAALMNKCSLLEEDGVSQEREHSIEVQLPFLQHRFSRFAFVPISVMNTDYSPKFLKDCEAVGKAIALAVKAGAEVIASSDFSHYISLDDARKKDREAIQQIEKLDPEGLFEVLDKVEASVCGYGPIAVLLYAARELKLKAKLIHSSSSADATGDKKQVVSYQAIGFC